MARRRLAAIAGAALLALLFAPTASARSVVLGTLTVTVYPVHYGDTVDFAWVLPKRPRSPTIGVYCYQGGTYHYIAELSVARDLVGTTHGEIQIDNADSSAVPGTLDYSQPAYCSGVMWDEYANGQQPQAITNSVSFTVSP